MKKYFYNFLAALLILATIAACASQPTKVAPPAASSEPTPAKPAAEVPPPVSTEKRTLHLMASVRTYPGEAEAWAEVISAFEEEYNVTVQARWQGQWTEIPQQLETSRLAGEPVDISSAGAGLINSTLARAGIIKDMTEFIEPIKDRWADGMLIPYTINERIWGVPYASADTTVFAYNKTMFDELGITEPKTYEELVSAAKLIAEQKQIMPMVHQGKAPWFWPIWFFETYAQTTGNTSIENINEFLSGMKKFTGPEEVTAFEKIANFYKDGVLTQESFDIDDDGMKAIFAQEKSAFFYGGTWTLAQVRSLVQDSFEIGVFEFPLVTDGAFSQHGGGASDAFVIPSFADPANYDLSRQFLEFITRKENATKILSCRNPLGPSIKSVPPTDTEPLANELVAEFFPHTITFLDWIWPVEINDAFVNGIPAVLSGVMTPEQAAQSVQDAYDTLVEEKDYKFDWWTSWTDADWAKVKMENLKDIEIKD